MAKTAAEILIEIRDVLKQIAGIAPLPPPIAAPPLPPAPVELEPITNRLDVIANKLDALAEDIRGGAPVAMLDRYSGTDTDYQKVVEWEIGKVWGLPRGDLREVSIVCETAAVYGHAVFKLTIRGANMFEGKKTSSNLSFPFPSNDQLKLAKEDRVTIWVKSDDGTSITVDGSITGREH